MASSAPAWLSVIPENLPRELVDDHAWYPGLITPRKNKPGKWNKKPADPETAKLAEWSDPTTRCTFDQAYMAYQRDPRFKCIGYMMHADAGVIGIDLDDTITEDGSIKPWAQEIVDSFPGAYWERSISGTGLRGFCRGSLPEGIGGCKRTIDGCSAELYCDVRYLAVTGHAIGTVDALPTLQDAVDALHTRLGGGRARATGTAVQTGLTGRVTDLTPAELAILEDVMGGRWGAPLSEIWSRDELDAAGASEEDWALEKEIAYWTISRGLEGDALALTVERIMRAGPYRSKWDEARGAGSWLAQDVANAIKTTQERLKKYAEQHPDLPAGWANNGPTGDMEDGGFSPDDAPAAPETLEQKVTRLERENRQLRATNAVQMTVINGERAERQGLADILRGIGDVLARPKEHLAPAAKILTIVALLEAHSRASRGISKLPSVVLEERSGMTKNMVSAWIQDLSARAASPVRRRLTREWRTNEHGIQEPITVSEVIPIHATVGESLAAVLTMGGPSTKAQRQRAAAQERATKARRWGRCSSHDNDLVAVKGYCPDCGEVVGERVIRVEEFDALNPLIHEIRESDQQAGAPVHVRTKGHEIRESGLPTQTALPTEILNHIVRESGPPPVSLLDYAVSRSPEPPKRCPAPGCGAMEFKPHPDGSWRCLKSSHDPRAYGQFTPSAEWQDLPDGYACPPGVEWRTNLTTGTNQVRWPEMAAVSGGSE
jgi:hypothetical protein